jgi:hypothetical protein
MRLCWTTLSSKLCNVILLLQSNHTTHSLDSFSLCDLTNKTYSLLLIHRQLTAKNCLTWSGLVGCMSR